MRSDGFDFPVVNAGISGDSTDNGLARLEKILRYPVAVLLVELGINDALMHHRSPDQIRGNLARIIVRGKLVTRGKAKRADIGNPAAAVPGLRRYGTDHRVEAARHRSSG